MKATSGQAAASRDRAAASPAAVERVMRTLAREIDGMELPAIEKISGEHAEDPFRILIGTLLSARTQDATTHAASTRLFRVARTPKTMAALTVEADREADLPGELLPQQGEVREGDGPGAGRAIRGQGAGDARGARHAARRWPQDRQSRDDHWRFRAGRTSASIRTFIASQTVSAGCERRSQKQTERALYEAVDRIAGGPTSICIS